MTLLSIVQAVCLRSGLTMPPQVMTSQDDTYLQLVGLLNELLDDLTTRFSWSCLVKQAVHTTSASEDQGALDSLAPYGFQWMVDGTLYDRTSNLRIEGPLDPQQWAASQGVSGPGLCFRLQNGHLHLLGNNIAGHQLTFEYMSDWAIKTKDVSTPYRQYFNADDDVCLFPDKLMKLGLRWKWKKEKGLAYQEEFRQFESTLLALRGKDGSSPTLNMSGEPLLPAGIIIPIGSWRL